MCVCVFFFNSLLSIHSHKPFIIRGNNFKLTWLRDSNTNYISMSDNFLVLEDCDRIDG